MRNEANREAIYSYGGVDYARIQLLSIEELLVEKREFRSPTKM